MEYQVVKDRDTRDTWRVEAINEDGDGEVYVAVFSGPDAEGRATEYAAWKNSNVELARAS